MLKVLMMFKKREEKAIILIACVGTSPAVLIETIWALAHQKTPIVPDEIVVLVTMSGKEKLCREVLAGEKSVWNEMLSALRKEKIAIDGKLVFADSSIHVIPDEHGNGVWNLRSGDDNLRAADFMLRQIRQYTEASDTVVLASIAGGRKTMSALLFSCMSLLGREDDKVFHVLLPPEFEGGVEPPMYYPKKCVVYTNRITGKKYKGDKFHSELFEVPFVRMRGWYQEKFKSSPPTYRTLISKVQTVAPPAVVYPEIEIDAWNGGVIVNGVVLTMSKPCFALLVMLASGCDVKSLHERLLKLHALNGASKCDWLATFSEGSLFSRESDTEDLNKTMSNLRKKLKEGGFENPDSLVPQRGAPVMFPISRIRWRNQDRLLDICGYLISTSANGNIIKYAPSKGFKVNPAQPKAERS